MLCGAFQLFSLGAWREFCVAVSRIGKGGREVHRRVDVKGDEEDEGEEKKGQRRKKVGEKEERR